MREVVFLNLIHLKENIIHVLEGIFSTVNNDEEEKVKQLSKAILMVFSTQIVLKMKYKKSFFQCYFLEMFLYELAAADSYTENFYHFFYM